jgi:phage tail sheath protein FI
MTRPAPTASPPAIPGVYRDVVPAQQRSADPPTGVCALLGLAERGPVGDAVVLRRPDEFAGTFGAPPPGSSLAAAVAGFFAAGGTSCTVVRIEPADVDWLARGLAALAASYDVDLVAVPDLACAPAARRVELQRAVLADCERLGTRFAVLDALPDATTEGTIAQRTTLNSRFGALYAPWVRLADGSTVPPSGHVAGLYAQSDRTRGVGAAPANLELAGVLDLVPPPGPADLGALTGAGVNPLRVLPGRGIRVWGDRTLAGPREPEWSSVGVCRLFIALTRWLATVGDTFAFEPDALPLWVRVRRELTERLWAMWRRGDLAGATPEEAFYVSCDAATNPAAVRDSGLVIAEVGLAPSVPAEFVVVRLVHQDGRTTLA